MHSFLLFFVGSVSAAGAPLTLAECVRAARASHPQVAAAEASRRAANAGSASAWSAILPSVTGDASTSRSTSNPHAAGASSFPVVSGTGLGAGVQDDAASTSYSASVTGRQTVFDLARFAAVGQARASAREADDDLRRAVQGIHFGAAKAFYDCLRSLRLAEVQEGQRRQLEEHARRARAMHEVGSRSRMDVLQAEASLANARVAVLRARNAARVARLSLSQAMGETAYREWDPADALGAPAPAPALELLREAGLARRPDLRAAGARLDAASAGVRGAWSEFLPTASASAAYRWSGDELPTRTWNWSVGGGVSWSLFSSFGGLARVRAASAREDAAQASYESARQAVLVEIEQAHATLRETFERADAAAAAAAQAALALELAETRYRTGAGSALELSDARSSRLTADTNRIEALCDRAVAAAALARAAGLLGEEE